MNEPKKIANISHNDFQLNLSTHVYKIDGKPVIWQYWVSDYAPLYVRLLIDAMQCRNPEFRVILVHDSTIRYFLPDFNVLQEKFDGLIPQHKADLFRAAIIRRYGGVYADVDKFVLNKL